MKVLLIESHALLRAALCRTLEEVEDIGEVVTVDPAKITASLAVGEAIAFVVLGLPEDPEAAWHLLCQVAGTWPAARVLVLSDYAPANWVDDQVMAGVVGCLPKSVGPDVLKASIRLVASGYQVSLGPFRQRPGVAVASNGGPRKVSAARKADTVASRPTGDVSAPGEARLLGLTPRQYEILLRLARGYPAKTISRELNVSVATVKCHCNALYKALGVRSKGEAVHVALQRGARLGQAIGPGPGHPPPQAAASPPQPAPHAADADSEDCPAL